MKQTKRKIVTIMMLCTILSVLIVGFLSVYTSNKIVDENSVQRMTLLCKNNAQQIDVMMDSLEQSVDVLAKYAKDSIGDPYQFRRDSTYVKKYTEKIRTLFWTMAQETNGAMSVYIRYNPEFTSPTSGLFILYNSETGQYENQTPTDLSLYSPDDTEHVGWYYIPVEKGGPTWISPYQNENIGSYLISYVVPLYIGGVCYGVVGMDIDFNLLQKMVNGISVYDTGFAFLVDESQNVIIYPGVDIYTPVSQLENGAMADLFTASHVGETDLKYQSGGEEWSASLTQLGNGMILAITAPVSEIFSDSTALTIQIAIVSLGALVFVLLVALFVATKMLRPATTDALTGINNRQAFLAQVRERMTKKGVPYAFLMLDIDHFKQINDSLGHTTGDEAIRQFSAALCRVLPNEDLIGRFGGDEFLAFMQCGQKAIVLRRIEQLRQLLSHGGELYAGGLTCSIGVVFSDDYSISVEDLLCRSDAALYQAKALGRDRYVFFEEGAMPSPEPQEKTT